MISLVIESKSFFNSCFLALKSFFALFLASSINFCKSCLAFLISLPFWIIWVLVDELFTLLFCNIFFISSLFTFWPSSEFNNSSNAFLVVSNSWSCCAFCSMAFFSFIFLVNESIFFSIAFVLFFISSSKSLSLILISFNFFNSFNLSILLNWEELISFFNWFFLAINSCLALFAISCWIWSSCFLLIIFLLIDSTAFSISFVAFSISLTVELLLIFELFNAFISFKDSILPIFANLIKFSNSNFKLLYFSFKSCCFLNLLFIAVANIAAVVATAVISEAESKTFNFVFIFFLFSLYFLFKLNKFVVFSSFILKQTLKKKKKK